MASIARRLGRWTAINKEPEETVEKDSRAPNRQSVDSHNGAVSGLESQSSQSTHLTHSSRSNGSSETTQSEPDSPSKNASRLQHKMSSVFSYFSETIRSTTSIFHPLEAGTTPSAPSGLESPRKYRRHRSSTSAISRPSEAEKLLYETTEFETPKKHRRYSSVISSGRRRMTPSTPRARETQKCAISSPTTPVRASQEQPPQLDVKIPNSFLSDQRSRSTVSIERIPTGPLSELFDRQPREATRPCAGTTLRELCNLPPDVDGGFDTEEDFLSQATHAHCARVISGRWEWSTAASTQPMLGNDSHGLPNESNAGMKALHEVLPAMLDNATPGSAGAGYTPSSLSKVTPESHLAARKELEPEVKSARDDLTLPHRSVPLVRFDTSDLSSPRNNLSRSVPSKHAHRPNLISQRRSCSDASFSLEPDTNLYDRLLSPGAYEADVSSCGTSPEHPSMGDRAAIAQRRADREKRYLETTLEGPDTESDDNSQSALELSRVPAAHASDNSQLFSETMRDDPANASDINWKMDLRPATRNKSELVDAVDFGMEMEIPAAKSLTADRSLNHMGDLHYAVEAIERASGDTIWPTDLPYAVEAIDRTPGYMLPAPRDSTFEVESSASSTTACSVPSAPKYAMESMCVTPDDFVALKPKQSDDKSFSVISSTDLSTDVPLELLTSKLLSENELETETEERSGPEKFPRICQDTEFWQRILFPGSWAAEHRQETEDWMSDYFGIPLPNTSYTACSFDSSNLGFPSQKSSATRRASSEENRPSCYKAPTCSSPVSSSNSDGSPRFIPSPQFEIKRFQLPEVKPTADIGYQSDDELTSEFNQGSPASLASLTPGGSYRTSGQKAVCFAKDVEIINHNSPPNLSPRKASPARPAKRSSGGETARKVQRDLEVRNEAAVQRLCQRLQERPDITLEEPEASSPEKPRWRVP